MSEGTGREGELTRDGFLKKQ
jgi:hypothetical protein